MNYMLNNVSRRGFMAAGGAGLALAALMPQGKIHAETKEVEKANQALVQRMCDEISPQNPAGLSEFLADDFVFQLIDGQPLVEGKETFLKFVGTFFAPFESADFIVHRMHTIGNLVINERTDNFKAKEGGQDASFHVAGFCLVKDGKIVEWKDYGLPE